MTFGEGIMASIYGGVTAACPHVATDPDGTTYCTLAADAPAQLAEARALLDAWCAAAAAALARVGRLYALLHEFDIYASTPADSPYSGSPFQSDVWNALGGRYRCCSCGTVWLVDELQQIQPDGRDACPYEACGADSLEPAICAPAAAANDGEDLAPLRAQTLAWMEGS